jgi:hypothetical protein
MAIGTNASIYFWGTQDEVTSSAGTVADGAYSSNTDIDAWTNDDDAPMLSVTWKGQFDTTMPTVGSIDLYVALENVQSTNDEGDVDANNPIHYLGSFQIDFGVSADADFYAYLFVPQLPPGIATSQQYHFFIHNNGSGQTMGTGWQLWVTPVALGPHG